MRVYNEKINFNFRCIQRNTPLMILGLELSAWIRIRINNNKIIMFGYQFILTVLPPGFHPAGHTKHKQKSNKKLN